MFITILINKYAKDKGLNPTSIILMHVVSRHNFLNKETNVLLAIS